MLRLGILLVLVASASAVVIGIDYGFDWTKIAIVKPGMPLEVVLNVESQRKTPSTFTVHDDEVLVGNSAAALSGRFPERVLGHTQRILGQSWDSPLVQEFMKTELNPLVKDPKRGVPVFVFENGTIAVETVVSSLLQTAKRDAENYGQTSVRDVVITVPVFYSQHSRKALMDAAEIAGLNVLALINDNTAIALNYGVLRPIEETPEKPRRVLFYDMGAGSLKVSVVEFFSEAVTGKKAKTVGSLVMKGVAFDRTLGGYQFDLRLADKMAEEFNAAVKGPDVKQNARAMSRLRAQAAKTKLVLSANNEIPVRVESLVGEHDYKGHITREGFETMCADLLARVTAPVDVALAHANLTVADLDEVVMVGGGARIPKIQEILKQYFGREALDKNINADEAAVLGAAFYGAVQSASFRAKEFRIKDVTPFGVGVTFATTAADDQDEAAAAGGIDVGATGADAKEKTTVLFKPFNKLPSKKVMSFVRTEDFTFSVDYTDPALVGDKTGAHIATYNISNLKDVIGRNADKINKDEAAKVKVSFELTNSGILTVSKAELTFNETVVEPEKAGKKSDSWFSRAKDFVFGSEDEKKEGAGDDESEDGAGGANKEDGEEGAGAPPAEGAAPPADAPATPEGEAPKEGEPKATGSEDKTDAPPKDAEAAAAAATDDKEKAAEPPKMVTRVRSRHVRLSLSESNPGVAGMDKEDLSSARDQVNAFWARDAERKALAKARNELESFIYNTREKVYDDEFVAASTEAEREAITAGLSEAGDWLEYGAGATATQNDFKDKLVQVRKLTRPVTYRMEESRKLPEAIKEAREMLSVGQQRAMFWVNETMNATAKGEEPRLTHAELMELFELWNTSKLWLEEKEAEQAALSKTDEPILTAQMIRSKLDPLAKKLTYFHRKPKPKKRPPPPPYRPDPPALTPLGEDVEGVNDAPVFTVPPLTSVLANTTYEYQVQTADPDAEDTRTVTAPVLPEWLTLTPHTNGSATLTGTAPNDAGYHNITLVVTDAGGMFDTMTYVIGVRPRWVPPPPRSYKKTEDPEENDTPPEEESPSDDHLKEGKEGESTGEGAGTEGAEGAAEGGADAAADEAKAKKEAETQAKADKKEKEAKAKADKAKADKERKEKEKKEKERKEKEKKDKEKAKAKTTKDSTTTKDAGKGKDTKKPASTKDSSSAKGKTKTPEKDYTDEL